MGLSKKLTALGRRRQIAVGLVAFGALLAAAAAMWPSAAVEVFIDATRGEIKKIPIAVFTFKENTHADGGNLTETLKADLRRSLLFDVPDLKSLGIKPDVTSWPNDES